MTLIEKIKLYFFKRRLSKEYSYYISLQGRLERLSDPTFLDRATTNE